MRIAALLLFMFITGEGFHHDHPLFVIIGIIGCVLTLVSMVGAVEDGR